MTTPIRTIAALLAAAVLLSAQAPAPAPADPLAGASAAMREGRYLRAVDGLAAAAFDRDGRVRDRDVFRIWAQYAPYISHELDPALLDRLPGGPPLDPGSRARIAAAVPRDAVAEIVRRARLTNIVILNEAHHSPRDRAFALAVARALRPLGYAVLAAEAFTNTAPGDGAPTPAPVDALARDGFARRTTGTYTEDPVYADFVRQALGLGYRPVAYEITGPQRSPGGGIAEREQAQAANLMARVFARAPGTKALIFVGHDHVAESPLPGGDAGTIEWMAARLKRMAGVDPLTIDQTEVSDTSFGRASREAHALAAGRIGDRPAILLERGRPLVLGHYAGAVDLQIAHPRRGARGGRPVWLARMGRRAVQVPRALLPAAGRHLVQAFAADAPADAVPLDQIVVEAGSPPAELMLPAMPVRFAIQR